MHCWAASLGDCAGGRSGEHWVSAGIFEGTSITVQGFPWCKDAPREIGLASAVANVLCKRHNELLSGSADDAGVSAFRTLREVNRLQEVRAKMPRRRWSPRRHMINGTALERWFLKTALTLACLHEPEVEWPISGSPQAEPPPDLVAAAFGRASLFDPLGLYFAVNQGQGINLSHTFQSAPILWAGRELWGVGFVFYGFRFVLSLMNNPMPRHPPFLRHLGEGWAQAGLLRHMGAIRFMDRGYLSQRVEIGWEDRRPR